MVVGAGVEMAAVRAVVAGVLMTVAGFSASSSELPPHEAIKRLIARRLAPLIFRSECFINE